MQHPLRRTTDQHPLRRITDRVVQSGAAAAEQAMRPVEIPAPVVRELAYFLESHGRMAARAGDLRALGRNEVAAEYAHDIARTYIGGAS